MNKDIPAILGGIPILKRKLPAYNTIGKEEKRAALRVLNRGVLGSFVARKGEYFLGGKEVLRFEKIFCKTFDMPYAISVNSATSALHVAVAALGIGPGDEVIVPPFTMSATASAILMHNAIPVFSDIEDKFFGLDPSLIEEKITPRTKAIMVVHLFGLPARIDKIISIAKRHKLRVIEDASQAPMAAIDGKKVGTFGDFGVFSLNCHKIVQCGEGGVLVCSDKKLAYKAQLVRNHGEQVLCDGKLLDKATINILGWNYKLTELQAAIATEQIKKLKKFINHRITLAEYLTEKLGEFDGITPTRLPEYAKGVFYAYPFKYDENKIGLKTDIFVNALQQEGFPVKKGYTTPLYYSPIYRSKIAYGSKGCPFTCPLYKGNIQYRKGLCPVTERLYSKELVITTICRNPLSKKHIDLFIEAIRRILDNKNLLKKRLSQ